LSLCLNFNIDLAPDFGKGIGLRSCQEAVKKIGTRDMIGIPVGELKIRNSKFEIRNRQVGELP